MPNVKLSSIPIRNSQVTFRQEFDEWAVLFDPEQGTAYAINPVSAIIWKNLDGIHSAAELKNFIENEFDAVPDTVEEDIVEFIQDMVEKGFVKLNE